MRRHFVQLLSNRSCGENYKNAYSEESHLRRKFDTVTDEQIVQGELQKTDSDVCHMEKDPMIEIVIKFVIDLKKKHIK